MRYRRGHNVPSLFPLLFILLTFALWHIVHTVPYLVFAHVTHLGGQSISRESIFVPRRGHSVAVEGHRDSFYPSPMGGWLACFWSFYPSSTGGCLACLRWFYVSSMGRYVVCFQSSITASAAVSDLTHSPFAHVTESSKGEGVMRSCFRLGDQEKCF